ncbi:MAG: hypothetical protein SCALA702_36530 [Melioribacteraceae bacterium]|nr:MAG: hypothetical protein SCALA702_36530 [Melioribacteraceae bacterium]
MSLALNAGLDNHYITSGIIYRLVSAALFLISPLLIISKKIRNLLSTPVNLIGSALMVISLFVLFPELCIDQNAGFFPETSGYRLRPPFTSGIYIEKSFEPNSGNILKMRDNLITFKSLSSREYLSTNKSEVAENSNFHSKFFLLGTDYLGRDLLALIISATRVSFLISVTAGLLAAALGIIFGFISGYDTKIAGNLLDRFSDAILAIPGIFFVLLLTLFFSSDIFVLVLILGLSGWMSLFKIVRTQVSEIKRKDFFRTSKLMGLPFPHLIFNEIFPVIMGPIVVNITFLIANIILAEAALSYLGVDFGTSTPTWGQLIEQGQQYIRKNWWLVVFPSLTLSFTIITIYGAAKKLEKKFRY